MLKWEDVTRLAIRLNGVPVLGCRPGSPAAVAGVQYGDILMAVNDMPTPDWAAYIEARALNRGRMRVEVFRGGETLVLEFMLAVQSEPIDPVAGHVPGAVNRFWQKNLQPDGRFKPAAALRQEFEAALGATPAESAVHMCGSGVTACHNIFAMELAGLPGGRLYPGSWSEWCADPSRPVATGD